MPNDRMQKSSNEEDQIKSEDLSFQVMPGEEGLNPQPEPTPILNSKPAELPQDGEHHGLNHKVVYIVLGILILAALAAGAYFMLGTKATTKKATETESRLPKDWLKKNFNVETCEDQNTCGDNADPDHDGLTNYEEFKARKGTDPHNPDSDTDGLADGDEAHIFKTEPAYKFTACLNNTGVACQFDDGSQISNDYDPLIPGSKMTETRKKQIADDTEQYKLHEPTPTTLQKARTTSQTSTESSAQKYTINIAGNKFSPVSITVKVGESVVWVNSDSINHQIASDPHPTHTDLPGLESPVLSTNQNYTFKLTKAGTFGYHDHLNPSIKGTIVVK